MGDIVDELIGHYPDPHPFLEVKSPLESLVATILSAQCTDERVNLVIKDLFRRYRTVQEYADADQAELEVYIRSTGFFRSKAKSIIGAARMILMDYGGVVPKDIDELVRLPGVGRKTANIVLSNGYGIVAGIPVDTHIKRVSFRLGLTENRDPVKIEQDLMGAVPREKWSHIAYAGIRLGRQWCKAPVPTCSKCFLHDRCPKEGVRKHR